jgi:tetratricopeptide (TPR) repeat protein
MLDVYSYVRMYQFDPGVTLLIGSEQPLDVEENMARTGRPLNDDVLGYLEKGIGSTEDLIVALTMDQNNIEDFAADMPLITDDRNYMATRSAQVTNTETGLLPQNLYNLVKAYDPLIQVGSWLGDDFVSPLNFSYITRRLGSMGLHQRSLDLTERLFKEGDSQAFVAVGLGLQAQGNRDDSQNNLRQALTLNPEDQQARYALLQPWFEDMFRGTSVPEYVQEERVKLSGSAADVIRGLIALENNDMPALVELDAELAAVMPTDLWYTTSVKLRAEWRIQLTSPEYQPRMLNEATALIDSAIAIFLDVQQYMMRIRSTYIAEDFVSALATARSAIRMISDHVDRLEQGSLDATDATINVRIIQLDELTRVMQDIAEGGQFTNAEVEPILQSVGELKSRLLNL